MKKAISIILTICVIVLCVSVVWADDSHIHTYIQKQIERTCTEQGYSIFNCECGDTYTDKYVEPGHTWDIAEITKEPSATSPGERKYRCVKCSFEKTALYYGIEILKDVVYGEEKVRQSVNIILPKDVKGDCGLIFNIHAGAWKTGDKSGLLESDIEKATKTGIAVASLNFRYLSEETNLDDILLDITNALKKVKDVAKRYGLNINKVMLQGGSSGGHLALLYAYKMKAVSPIEIACVYAFSAPSDLSNKQYIFSKSGKCRMEKYLSEMMGKDFFYCKYKCFEEELKKLSAQYYVDADAVPTGLVHGKLDTSVPYSDSENLKKLLDKYSIPNVLITLPHCSHTLDNQKDKELLKLANETQDVFSAKYLFDFVPGVIQGDNCEESHNFVKTAVVKPTCKSQGYTLYSCTDCEKSYQALYKKALSHIAGQWKIDKNPTCTQAGTKSKYCLICSEKMQTSQIPKTNHKKVIDKAVIPSCTRQPFSEGSHCAKCNHVFVVQKILSTDIHFGGEWEIVIPSTLMFDGVKIQRCVFCEKVLNVK